MDIDDEWIDENEVARILGVTKQTVWKYRHRPRSFKQPMPYYQFGRVVKFRKREFMAWVDLHRVGGDQPAAGT